MPDTASRDGDDDVRRESAEANRGFCVRDARPQGREHGADARAWTKRVEALERRGLGAVGNSCIVAYCARSPARSAAEGHAQILQSSLQMQMQKKS